jgi:hypothetical protein
MRRIGVLMPFAADDPAAQRRVLAFAQALAQSGWTDGRNVRIDIRKWQLAHSTSSPVRISLSFVNGRGDDGLRAVIRFEIIWRRHRH